jgi:hypothetical protein
MWMFLAQVDPSTGTIVETLVEQYGITGLAFGILLTIMLRQNKSSQKRIENLEAHQQEQHAAHMSDQKEMINDYIDLVKNKTSVLADLTGCLKAMKDTLERMERKGQ